MYLIGYNKSCRYFEFEYAYVTEEGCQREEACSRLAPRAPTQRWGKIFEGTSERNVGIGWWSTIATNVPHNLTSPIFHLRRVLLFSA